MIKGLKKLGLILVMMLMSVVVYQGCNANEKALSTLFGNKEICSDMLSNNSAMADVLCHDIVADEPYEHMLEIETDNEIKTSATMYEIVSFSGVGGSITPTQQVNAGSDAIFEIQVDDGYIISQLIIDDVDQLDDLISNFDDRVNNYQYKFKNVNTTHTITVRFGRLLYIDVAITNPDGGEVICRNSKITASPVKAIMGGNIQFSMKANDGYQIKLFIDGIQQTLTNKQEDSFAFTGLTKGYEFKVEFVRVGLIRSNVLNNGSFSLLDVIDSAISYQLNTLYEFGTKIQLTVNANTGYVIKQLVIDGVEIDVSGQLTTKTEEITINKDEHTLNIVFEAKKCSIVTDITGVGTIKLTSGEALPSKVDYWYEMDITISADEHYYIASVLVNDVNKPISSSTQVYHLEFTCEKDLYTIKVVFEAKTYTINVIQSTGGTIQCSNATINANKIQIRYNYVLQFAISAHTHYHIKKVLIGGIEQSLAGNLTAYQCDLNVIGDSSITAEFELDQYPITIIQNNGGSIMDGSTVALNTIMVDYDTNRTFQIKCDDGYYINRVKIDGEYVDDTILTQIQASEQYTFQHIAKATSLEVEYEIYRYTISTEVQGSGEISCEQTSVNWGDVLHFEIKANPGYVLDSLVWTIIGGASQNINVSQLTRENNIWKYTTQAITNNYTLSATFKLEVYRIVATANGNGQISPSGITECYYGDDVDYCITAQVGYKIESVKIDGQPVEIIATYKFEAISGSHTIEVTFVIQRFGITTNISGKGGVESVLSLDSVDYGTERILMIKPEKGYMVNSVKVNGAEAQLVDGQLTISDITEDYTIDIEFVKEKANNRDTIMAITIISLLAGVVIIFLLLWKFAFKRRTFEY